MSQLTYELISRHVALHKDYWLEQALRAARKLISDQVISFGNNLQLETFPLPHSIPETMGLVIKGKRARLIYLSDFKFNGMESWQKAKTINILQRITRDGVDILALNIINAHIEGFTPLEALVVDSLTDIMMRAQGRVIIACFASNLERIRRFAETVRLLQRPIQFLGVGMESAKEFLGLEDEGMNEKSVIFVTGCQAEEKSVLWRIAHDQNPPLRLEKGDTLVLSSRSIPGNETAIQEMVSAILPRVANVIINKGEKARIGLTDHKITERVIHVSGHGGQEDIRLALEILRPRKVLAWPQSEPQMSAFRAITKPLGIEILSKDQRVIEI